MSEILLVSDIHRDYPLLMNRLRDKRIKGCICCGDLTTHFPKDPTDANIPKPIYTVYGNNENWDYMGVNIPNLTWMTAGKTYKAFGIAISGMGGVESSTPQYPSHYTPGEVDAALSLKPKSVDIFVAHHPPKLYADLCTKNVRKHCGSHDTLKILENVKPKLFLAGHIHWLQSDIFGFNGSVDSFVLTLGQFGMGDFAILKRNKITVYKKNVKCIDIYWKNST